jgi:ATP-binding cassette, subfamily B, bacterial PglK
MNKYLIKFLYVLPADKSKLFYLVFLFIFASAIETFGIGLIGPFLQFANHPKFLLENNFLKSLYISLNLSSENHFVALLGLFIILIFIVKTFISWRVKTYVFKFSFTQRGELCRRLVRSYLNAPYTFHLTTSSSYIIQNVSQDTSTFANNFLQNLLNLASNVIVIISLIFLLGITNLVAVTIIMGMMLPLFFIFHLLRNKIRKWGKQTSRSNQAIIRSVGDSMGGIKETKIFNGGSYFEDKIIKIIDVYEEAAASLFEVKLIPRMLIETIMIVFIIGFTSSFLLAGRDVQRLTTELGVFAIAAIRLMPAITQLLSGMTTLRSSTYILDKLYSDLKTLESIEQSRKKDRPFSVQELSETQNGYDSSVMEQNYSVKRPFLKRLLTYSPADYQVLASDSVDVTGRHKLNQSSTHSLPFQDCIELENIAFCYPNMERHALHGINLKIRRGESIALIGRSGSGKTTLVDVILGLLQPNAGDIKVDGQSIYEDLRGWQNMIGYIPQSIFLTGDSIERNIAFGVPDELIDRQRLENAIHSAQLTHFIAELPQGLKTEVGERGVRLSGGQRQRIGIARALYHTREILILDEATSALDNETEQLVTEAIQALSGSKTMIIIAHRLSTVEHCDHVYQMEKGNIVQSGTYQEVVIQGNLL